MRPPKPTMQAIDVSGREPPHDLDAERAILSAALTSQSALDEVMSVLPTAEPFFGDAHQRIYETAITLRGLGRWVDTQTVASELRERDRLQSVGGLTFIARLVDVTPTEAAVSDYAQVVLDHYRARKAIEAAQIVTAEGYAGTMPKREFVAWSRATMDAACIDDGVVSSTMPIRSCVREAWDRLTEGMKSGTGGGLPSSLASVQACTGGYEMGSLTAVGSIEGGGKTIFALQEALHIARTGWRGEPAGVLVCSVEMPSDQVVRRWCCNMISCTVAEYRSFSESRLESILVAQEELAKLPICVDDAPKDWRGVLSAIKRAKREFAARNVKLRLVVVDHFHQMDHPRDKGDSQENAYGETARQLKKMAKGEDVALLVPAQFKDEATTRPGRVHLSDFKGSSAIRQNLDQAILIDRAHLKNPDVGSAKYNEQKQRAELLFGKARDGAPGMLSVVAVDRHFRFEDARS